MCEEKHDTSVLLLILAFTSSSFYFLFLLLIQILPDLHLFIFLMVIQLSSKSTYFIHHLITYDCYTTLLTSRFSRAAFPIINHRNFHHSCPFHSFHITITSTHFLLFPWGMTSSPLLYQLIPDFVKPT